METLPHETGWIIGSLTAFVLVLIVILRYAKKSDKNYEHSSERTNQTRKCEEQAKKRKIERENMDNGVFTFMN